MLLRRLAGLLSCNGVWAQYGLYLEVHVVLLTGRPTLARKENLLTYFSSTGAGLAQAVQCLTTGWTTGRSGFDPRRGQRIFRLASVS
jgi:hypothetical protein